MRNFFRALKQALTYWRSLAIAVVCSFAVAALWGANIGAFYPILEVTINGKSMHDWVHEEIATTETRVAELEESLKHEQSSLMQADESAQYGIKSRISDLSSELSTHHAKLASLQRSEPLVTKYIPRDPFNAIALIVAALIASTLIKHVFLISSEVLAGRVALDISRQIRMQVFAKALGMDRATYAQHGTAGFTSTITHTAEMLSRGLINALGAALREPLKVVSCLVGAGMICWRLLLLSVVIAPFVGWLLYLVTIRLRNISKSVLSKANGFHQVMIESLGNINTVQAFTNEEREEERFRDATLAMRTFGLKFIFYTSLSKPIIEFLGLGMLGTTIIGGAYLVLRQETSLLGIPICNEPLSVSALLVFFGMLVGLSDPLRKLSAVYSSIYAGAIAADGLYGILDKVNKTTEPEHPVELAVPHQMLSMRGVDFGYDAKKPILKDVTLDIPFGSTVVFVGQNGCGKSTLIHLLGRYYDPTQGQLCFDGVDFKQIGTAAIRNRIALVNQHTELFNETIEYNIKYGCPEASLEDVIRAARESHAHDFIQQDLPEGYETKVGQNGCKLSGGQRQRIALARALLCNPEILILDEATSQIDMRSEQLIRESLAEHRGQRTMIIITHREKLIELADQVFEVINGRFEERRLIRSPQSHEPLDKFSLQRAA